jgi:Calcineurin-like phosphoesterase.
MRGLNMFLPDDKPILYNTDRETKQIELYFLHDLHYGSAEFNENKWKFLKSEITGNPAARVLWIGDLMENAIPGSKSDVFTQTSSPAEQREWVTEQLNDLADKTIAVVPGNHEANRSTARAGLYPLYDACLIAGISEKYRDTYAIVDIGVGERPKDKRKQIHYVVQIQHKAKDIKYCNSADFTDGIDAFIYGHDHEPKDHPRAKLVYDAKNKCVYKRNVEVIDCGAFLTYGGYGAKAGYRPQSDKMYTLILSGEKRDMQTRGFYV